MEEDSTSEAGITAEAQSEAQGHLEEIHDQISSKALEAEESISEQYDPQIDRIEGLIKELADLHVTKLLTETQYRDHRDNFPGAFKAGMGAESVLNVLQNHIDLEDLRNDLQEEMQSMKNAQISFPPNRM